MEIPISLILACIALGWLSVGTYRRMFRAVKTPDSVAPSPGHQMVRVWPNNSATYGQRGWWYECSCGRRQPGSGISSQSTGSEERAINSYKAHAALYRTITTGPAENPFEKKYNDEVAAFQEYVSKCFCKDTNDDLLVLKHRHLDK